jgi:phage tail-like protein
MPDYAIYGVHFYGTAKYGKAPSSDFVLDHFTATPEGYSQVRIEWGKATGSFDRLRLVRGSYGYPTDEIDGQILFDAAPSGPSGAVLDPAVEPLRFYYYTLFLRLTIDGSWRRAGDVVCLVPGDFGYSDRLYELLPEIYTEGDLTYTIDDAASPDFGSGVLQTFMGVFGFELDNLRSELDSLLWAYDPNKVSGGLLPLLCQQLGLPFEAELGMALVRHQLNNIVYLYKIKGTRPGIEGAAYAFSGWAAKVSAEANLISNNDDASFEATIGRWSEQVNVTLSRQAMQGALTTSGTGVLAMTARSTGVMVATLPALPQASLPLLLSTIWPTFDGPAALPLLLGGAPPIQRLPMDYGTPIPDQLGTQTASLPLLILPGRPFTFSAYFEPATTVRHVAVQLFFYDKNNVNIGSATGPYISEIASQWVRATVTGMVPAGAVRAGYALLVGTGASLPLFFGPDLPVAGEIHYADALQLSPGKVSASLPLLLNQTPPAPWQPANGIKVVLLADRVNRCVNPSFETDVSGWTGVGATLSQVGSIIDVGGSFSCQVTTLAGQRKAGLATTLAVPVTAGAPMVFSPYWQAATTARPVVNQVDWYDAGGQKISSLADGPDTSLPMLLNPVTPALDAVGSWTRFSFQAVPPAGAVTAIFTSMITATSGTLPTGEIHYVDCVLIEQAGALNPYFDASTGTPAADYLWEATPQLSRSHYYHRRATRESRLRVRLPDFVPAGSTVRILDAQPL